MGRDTTLQLLNEIVEIEGVESAHLDHASGDITVKTYDQ